jgi:hypothetical protein
LPGTSVLLPPVRCPSPPQCVPSPSALQRRAIPPARAGSSHTHSSSNPTVRRSSEGYDILGRAYINFETEVGHCEYSCSRSDLAKPDLLGDVFRPRRVEARCARRWDLRGHHVCSRALLTCSSELPERAPPRSARACRIG